MLIRDSAPVDLELTITDCRTTTELGDVLEEALLPANGENQLLGERLDLFRVESIDQKQHDEGGINVVESGD